ncbi:MAG: hypothetical protein ACN6OP_11275 [Pseudomonadales bacterium]
MAYSLSLDLVALAIQEVKKGNLVNASRLFVSAAQDESADKALRMIQATNEHALKVAAAAQAAAKAAPAKAAKPVKAAPAKALAGFEPTDASTMQVLKKLHAEAEDFVEEVEDEDEDGDDVVEDVVEEASAKPVNARVQAAAFAKVLATMQSNAKKAAPAKK